MSMKGKRNAKSTFILRQQNLFCHAHHEKRDAAREFIGCKPAIFELIGEERELENRPRD